MLKYLDGSEDIEINGFQDNQQQTDHPTLAKHYTPSSLKWGMKNEFHPF